MGDTRLDSVKYSDAKSLWESEARSFTDNLPRVFHVGVRINLNRTQAKDLLDSGFFTIYIGYYMSAVTADPSTKDTMQSEAKTWIGDLSHPQYAQLHPELPLIINSGNNRVILYMTSVPSYYAWIQEAYEMTNIDFVQGGHLGRDYLGITEWTSDPEYVFHKSNGDPIDLPLPINTNSNIFYMPALTELADFYTYADTLYWDWVLPTGGTIPYKQGGLSLLDLMNDNGYSTYTRIDFSGTGPTINAGIYGNWEDWATYGSNATVDALYETDNRFYDDPIPYGRFSLAKKNLANLVSFRTSNFETLITKVNPLYNMIADRYAGNIVGYEDATVSNATAGSNNSPFTTIYGRSKLSITLYAGYAWTGEAEDTIPNVLKRCGAQISQSYSYNIHIFNAFITSRLGTSIQGTDDAGNPVIGDDPLNYRNSNPTSMDVPNTWSAATLVSDGDLYHPTVTNGYYYEVTTAGLTGLVEPVWPTTPGDTVNDNGVVWTCFTSKHLTTVGEVIMMTKFAMTMGAAQVNSYAEQYAPNQSFWAIATAYEEMQDYHQYIKYGINYQPNLCRMYYESSTSKISIPTVFYANDSDGNALDSDYYICARTYNGKTLYFGADLGAVNNTAISTVNVVSPFNTVDTINMSRYGQITEI